MYEYSVPTAQLTLCVSVIKTVSRFCKGNRRII